MFEDIDFGKGVVSKYIDFNININIPLTEQIVFLKEDIVQICYENKYILDIGWYPEFNVDGSFKLVIVREYNWEDPIIKIKCRDINILKTHIEECVCLIQNEL